MMRRALRVSALTVALYAAVALAGPALAHDVGVEWINAFPDNAGCDKLDHCDECAEKFYDKFTDKGWTGRYCLGNDNAWEEHFKEAANGGTDQYYVDTVDIALIASHGCPTGVSFNARHDDQKIGYTEAQWGDDNDLEWIILDACSCLDDAKQTNWQRTFDGLHMILGFDTTAHDQGSRGKELAKKLFSGYSLVQAWFHAGEVTEGSSTWVAAKGVRAPHDTYGDHIHGEGSVATDSRPASTFWYSRHNCD